MLSEIHPFRLRACCQQALELKGGFVFETQAVASSGVGTLKLVSPLIFKLYPYACISTKSEFNS